MQGSRAVHGAEDVTTDRTPRDYRVPETAITDGPLTGVTEVLVGVASTTEPAEWFQRLHDYPTPLEVTTPLAADVATVPGQPVSFVEPDTGSELATRLSETEQQPLAFLLGTDDFDVATERYAVTDIGEWDGRPVAWFDADPLRARVGVLEVY